MSDNSQSKVDPTTAATSAFIVDEAETASHDSPAPKVQPPIALAAERYLSAMRGIAQTAQIALPHMASWKLKEYQALHQNSRLKRRAGGEGDCDLKIAENAYGPNDRPEPGRRSVMVRSG